MGLHEHLTGSRQIYGLPSIQPNLTTVGQVPFFLGDKITHTDEVIFSNQLMSVAPTMYTVENPTNITVYNPPVSITNGVGESYNSTSPRKGCSKNG